MQQDIYIGTLVQVKENTVEYLKQIIPYGFESFAFTFGHNALTWMEPAELAEKVMPLLKSHGIRVGAISAYGNPLGSDERAETIRAQLKKLVEAAHLFETDVVSGFTGRVPGKSVPDTMEDFKRFWTPLCERAAELNVRVAFENCVMGGTWENGAFNLAYNPAAWELMFEAIPLPNIGLEWEPTHQMTQLIDPMPQLREWGKRIFHLHGKDANIKRDIIARYGITGVKPFVYHRHPGFGDCNWTDIISELRMAGFKGSIDIEGWHDPVYKGELEMTGQVHALNYLKQCRTTYVPNPVV